MPPSSGLSQGVRPVNFAKGALLAARREFGNDPEAIRAGFAALWQTDVSAGEAAEVLDLVLKAEV